MVWTLECIFCLWLITRGVITVEEDLNYEMFCVASCRIGKRGISLGVDYKVRPFFVDFFSVKPLMTRYWEEERSKELIVRIGSTVIKSSPKVGEKAESFIGVRKIISQ